MTLLNDTVTNTGATLQVDDGITLTLSGTTINGGTINDFSGTAGGNIDVTVASKIAGTSAADANLNGDGAGSTVTLDAALTLDYVKLSGITIENGTALTSGPLTIVDTVEVAGAVELLNDTVTNPAPRCRSTTASTLTLSEHHHQRRHHQRFQRHRRRQYRCHRRQHDRRHQRRRRQPQRRRRRQYGDARCRADPGLRQAQRHHHRERHRADQRPAHHRDTVEVAGAVTLLNDTVTNTGATLQVDDGRR